MGLVCAGQREIRIKTVIKGIQSVKLYRGRFENVNIALAHFVFCSI